MPLPLAGAAHDPHRARCLRQVSRGHALAYIVKMAATTLDETGEDSATMSMHLGYAVGTATEHFSSPTLHRYPSGERRASAPSKGIP